MNVEIEGENVFTKMNSIAVWIKRLQRIRSYSKRFVHCYREWFIYLEQPAIIVSWFEQYSYGSE